MMVFSNSLPVIPAVLVPSVSTPPGRMELIRIFLPLNSFDNETVIASKAALVAEYSDIIARGVVLTPELILIITPPTFPNNFTASLMVKSGPNTLTSKSLWNVSSVTS